MEIRNLSIGFTSGRHKTPIQTGINVSLKRGELTCLLGPNGAGKTTLMRTLAGLLPSLEGEITIDGKNIISYSRAQLSQLIGIVLTERPSVQSMNVEQLVALGRSPYTGFWGQTTETDKNIIVNSLKLTDTFKLRERTIETLSDGERQRVMIAKSIAQQTPYILLDEATAFLDFPGKAEIMILLAKLAREQNLAILQSTHDLNMALAISDSIWLIDKKLGFHNGTPRQLADAGLLQKYFCNKAINFNEDSLTFGIEVL